MHSFGAILAVVDNQWPGPISGPCVCTTLRRVTRLVTSHYDAALAQDGLTTTQYALLVRIGRAKTLTHNTLAENIGMDRTTLTRSIAPLIRKGWVAASAGTDRRKQILSLTPSGRKKVNRAYSNWEYAQTTMLQMIGSKEWAQLQGLLQGFEGLR
jgi:DNA-binding MarR family transcriptional regulator